MAEIAGLPAGATLRDITPSIEGLPEGATLRDVPKPKVSQTEDVLRSAGSGLATGVAGLPGVIGDISSMGNAGLNKLSDWIGKKLGYSQEEIDKTKAYGSPIFPTTERVKQMTGLDKSDYEPQTTGGRYAKSIAEMVPGAATGGARTVAGMAGNVAKFAIAPGAASELAGQTFKDSRYEGPARVAAGLLAPVITHGVMSPGRGFKGVPETEKAYADQVAEVKAKGIPVSPAEEQNSRQLRYTEDMLFPDAFQKNRQAVTRAATKEIGKGFDGATHETAVIEHGANGTADKMLKEIGSRYDDLNSRNSFDVTQNGDFFNEMNKIKNTFNAHPGIYGKDVVAAVNGWMDRIGKAITTAKNPLVLPGDEYHTILKDLRAKRMNASTSNEADALKQIEDQMTGAMEKSVRPEDLGRYKQTDRDYKNALALTHAMGRGTDHLSPDAIIAGAKNVYGNQAFERGASPFNWATSAKNVLRMVPESGTSHKAAFYAINQALGSGGAALAGSLLGHGASLKDPIEALLTLEHFGVPAGMLLPIAERPIYKALSPYLRNRWTAAQDAPVRSLPGLLSAADTERGAEERHKPKLSITVGPNQ